MRLLATWRASFAPLALPAVRLYLGGSGVSMLGNWLQQTAQALLVYRLSDGAATAVGMTSFCAGLPLLLLSPFTGALADRLDRRRLLIGCHAIEMMLACTLALLAQTGTARLGHVYVIAALLGVANAVHFPAQQALFFDLAGTAHVRKLISLNSVVLNIGRVGGPALAGVVVAQHGVAMAFWQNALTFLAVIGVLLRLRAGGHAHGANPPGSLRDALAHIHTNLPIRYAYFTCALLTMFGLASLTLAPALAHGDPRHTGLLLGAAGGGSLVYALFLSPFLNNLPRMGLALSLSLTWMGICQLAAATASSPVGRLVALFLFGLATSMAMVGSTGLVQLLAPLAMRGRLMGLFGVIGFGVQPVAALTGGWLADRIGARTALGMAGIAAIVGAQLLLRDRTWRLGCIGGAGSAIAGTTPTMLAVAEEA